MPRGITQISPGSASILPNSVKNAERILLRHDQQLAVGVVEVLVLHRLRDEIDVRGHAGLRVDVAGGGHGAHAGEEGELLLRDRHRAPAQLADRPIVLGGRRCRFPVRQRRLAELRAVLHRRADAIEPGALVGAARCREGRAGQLLGVQPVGACAAASSARPVARPAAPRSRNRCRSPACSRPASPANTGRRRWRRFWLRLP